MIANAGDLEVRRIAHEKRARCQDSRTDDMVPARSFLGAIVALLFSALCPWPAIAGILILAAVLASLIWLPPSGLSIALSFRTAKGPR